MRDGALALLGSIMERDCWRITLSGDSVVSTCEGIPEGSKYGPSCFNLLPNTLVKDLISANCGVSLSAKTPAAWRGHCWTGRGTPQQAVVDDVVARLTLGRPLPSPGLLAKDCDLEAACARALDITSDVRIPVLFHADDPVFLASSRGEANRVLSIVRSWASKYKATLHLAKHKTTAMVLPASAHSARAQVLPLRYLPAGQYMPSPISWAHSHKWLGISWDDNADFAVHARRTCGMCSGTVQALCSLLRSGHIPLAVACIIFDTKVEAALRFGRWLWGTHSEAVSVLSDAYASWARLLLGSSRWRSAEVCRAELGWKLCAPARVVVEVASVRHSLWVQNQDTLAGACFSAAHLLDSANWAKTSLNLLDDWTVLDWPVWSTCRRSHGKYSAYVKDVVYQVSLARWKTQVAKHVMPLKYLAIAQEPSAQVQDAFRLQLSWGTLVGHRDLLLLRCGFIMLGHVDFKPSRASVRHCIFCNKRYTGIYSHVVGRCEQVPCRRPCNNLEDLAVLPGDPRFADIVAFARAVCKGARQFWRQHGHPAEA